MWGGAGEGFDVRLKTREGRGKGDKQKVLICSGKMHVVLWELLRKGKQHVSVNICMYSLLLLVAKRMSSFQIPPPCLLDTHTHTYYFVSFNKPWLCLVDNFSLFHSQQWRVPIFFYYFSLIRTFEKSFLFWRWVWILNRVFVISSCLDFPRVSRNVFRQQSPRRDHKLLLIITNKWEKKEKEE